jgi:hypothetical protein
VLKNIEQIPEYEAMLLSLLGEIKPHIETKTGRMMRPQGYVFVSSPDAVTPYHFDPEHNILMQLRGSKILTQFPAGQTRYAPDQTHESYHIGGHRNLVWHESLATGGTVMAPHHVKNGPEPSISLSITWRSDWSFAEADARALNGMLRRFGMRPTAPARFPARNTAKAYIWRAISRLRRTG